MESAAAGLSSEVAAAAFARDGANELPTPQRVPAWRVFMSQLVHFFAIMLWVAGALAFLAGMPQLGVAIFIVILVNGAFAFAQEQRAERASQSLVRLLPVRVVVRRDSVRHEIDATEVVVGDLVLLSPGDRVVADLVALDAHGLQLDESMLTGESRPVTVESGGSLWAGTFLVNGEGTARVAAIGADTRLAGIAHLADTAARPPGPLAVELARVVRTMAVLTVGVGVAFFLLTRFTGTPARDGLLFAVGVTVALVPEGLLPTLTLSLAMGAQRMAQRHALVRHLQAVETLGSTTFVCTDKTGTLTRNEMSVVEIWTPTGSVRLEGTGYAPTADVVGTTRAILSAGELSAAGLQCSQGRAVEHDGRWLAVGDPMEAAIDALDLRLRPDRGEAPVSARIFAFDPQRRRASAIAGRSLFVKGAPDAVLPRCGPGATAAESEVERLAAQGLRVLAIATRDVAGLSEHCDADEAERDLRLLGLIGLEDPPRAEVADAISACRSAGVKVAMITGDHPATARAIASEIGMLGVDEIVLLGDELPAEDEALADLLDRDGVVISRATPEHKLRIARALQARGHVVAMTGDGVNDGPAMREADIGIAMGRSGTDVARASADLVLLDDNFATIVVAIEEGRATFTNIRRFLTYHLTDNVAELAPFLIWGLSGGRFPLALGVLQVISLDIVTDLLPALALGAEPPSPGLLARPLQGRHLIDGPLLRRVFGVLGPTEAVVEMLAFMTGLFAAGWRPGDPFPTGYALFAASGAAFAAVVIGQVGNAQACRSVTRPPRRLGWFSNRLLVLALCVQVLLLVALLCIPWIAHPLGQRMPLPAAALVAAAALPAVLIVDELHKAIREGRRPARVRRRAARAAAPAPVGPRDPR